jgi:GNAT superfamily N-acetyltransferase
VSANCINLVSWRDGERSVEKYYENYFKTELEEFCRGDLHYWMQATVDEKLVGWATFQREKLNPNEVYMNLLVVHPEYQKKGMKGLG